jgi:hypothetical protein
VLTTAISSSFLIALVASIAGAAQSRGTVCHRPEGQVRLGCAGRRRAGLVFSRPAFTILDVGRTTPDGVDAALPSRPGRAGQCQHLLGFRFCCP